MSKNWQTQKKFYVVFYSILLFCSSCATLASQDKVPVAQIPEATDTRGQMLPITAQVLIKQEIIDLEVAQTNEQQAMGLMFRETLPDNRGMFFPLGQPRITRFWMNNVPVPLDMIFIKESKVIAIANSAPPCQTQPQDCPLYGPDTVVDGVIELRSGRAKELGLAVGDSIEIKYLDNLQQK